MDVLYKLIEILEESIKKNGEKPLTNKWLLNILNMAEKSLSKDSPSEVDIDSWGDLD